LNQRLLESRIAERVIARIAQPLTIGEVAMFRKRRAKIWTKSLFRCRWMFVRMNVPARRCKAGETWRARWSFLWGRRRGWVAGWAAWTRVRGGSRAAITMPVAGAFRRRYTGDPQSGRRV